MLEKLPYELLAQCMKYLSPNEKLACLYVSKSWNEKAREFVYENLTTISPMAFCTSYWFFNNNKEYAKFVKRLLVLKCKVPASIYMSLPSLFPNIRTFCVADPEGLALHFSVWSEREAQIRFSVWRDTIEDVMEFGSPICVKALLCGGACPNLKRLEYGSQESEIQVDPAHIIQKLKCCTPNLTHLRLQFERKLIFDLQLMEELLDNTPNLKVLRLKYPYFMECTVDLNPSKIQPHPGLEVLVFHEVQFEEDTDQWITYFSKKLVHLRKLCINETLAFRYPSFYTESTVQLAKWMSKLSKLEMYSMQAFLLTESIVEAMDKSGMQLKMIDLGPYYAIGNYYKLLLNSKQKNSLETIMSSGSSYNCIVNDFQDFTFRLSEFKNLKHLSIFRHYMDSHLTAPAHFPSCYDEEIPLEQLIKNTPKLETLKLEKAECVVEYDKDEPLPKCPLRKLVLIDCKYNAVTRFPNSEDGHKKSWKYLKETVLPNTVFDVRRLNEVFYYMEYYINHLYRCYGNDVLYNHYEYY